MRTALLTLATLAVCWTPVAAQEPVPRTSFDGPVLEFDLPGLRIGVAEYDAGPTGTTVFHFSETVKAAADVRGGAPGTVNASVPANAEEEHLIDAVVFSGGSWYGLAAATGAANAIKDRRIAAGEPDYIAGVLGAIIYDVGWRRFSRVTPDERLARAALEAAESGRFPLGARGAGRLAMQGLYYNWYDSLSSWSTWAHSGQGGAFRSLGPTKLAVFTVVNSVGAVVDRQGRVVRCMRNQTEQTCPTITELLARDQASLDTSMPPGPEAQSNTTLTLVVTNQKLEFWALQRLARQVHGSMARAIQPFATQYDGDVLYAVTTDEVDNPDLSPMQLAVAASELAWDAVLASVPELPPAPSPEDVVAVDRADLETLAGMYAFPVAGELRVSMEDGGLVGRYAGPQRMYFLRDRAYELIPLGDDRFVVDSDARDVLQFERGDNGRGSATSIVLNPGPWAIEATRR